MTDACRHDVAEQLTAATDGMCPICMADELVRLRMESAALRRALEIKAINDNRKITGYDVTEYPTEG